MKNKSVAILSFLLILSLGFIVYQNFISSNSAGHSHTEESGLYTCGMHPDIISEEQGNCPICGMKLTPIKQKSTSSTDKGKVLYWKAPMDPNEIYDEPGKSKMGMDLVPVYENEAEHSGVVTIDGTLKQTMNVKTVKIERRTLNKQIVTSGVLSVDERKEFRINSKVSGWLEKLYINFEGQSVKIGEKLFDIYSPALVSAQQELLTAIDYAESIGESNPLNNSMVKNSIEKLKLFDLSKSSIDKIISSKKVERTLSYYSPVSGTLLMRNFIEGEKINKGATVLHITDLSSLWVKADIYESDLPFIKIGDQAEISFTYFPGKMITGQISFIYPTVKTKTRTVEVRIDISNKEKLLKPGMYASVELKGFEVNNAITIDESAVIRSGKQNIAVLALGEGKYKPVNIELGQYSEGYYEVLSGLSEGNVVVSSAQFLIDSEANLKAAIKQFDSGSNHKDEPQSELLRTGEIDVESIDKNNDGKLYECPMDWNLLRDEEGRCPICEMNLKEYSIDEVKSNLEKHGHKYKHSEDHTEIEHDHESHNEMDHKDHDNAKVENEYGVDHEFIRTGKIDVESLDRNKDSKLYECPMDWNIIADEYHRCPVCEMKMKEYSLEEIKTNLKKYGYDHK